MCPFERLEQPPNEDTGETLRTPRETVQVGRRAKLAEVAPYLAMGLGRGMADARNQLNVKAEEQVDTSLPSPPGVPVGVPTGGGNWMLSRAQQWLQQQQQLRQPSSAELARALQASKMMLASARRTGSSSAFGLARGLPLTTGFAHTLGTGEELASRLSEVASQQFEAPSADHGLNFPAWFPIAAGGGLATLFAHALRFARQGGTKVVGSKDMRATKWTTKPPAGSGGSMSRPVGGGGGFFFNAAEEIRRKVGR